MITGRQIRKARKLVRWGQDKLAMAAGVEVTAVMRAEGLGDLSVTTLDAVVRALESAGVEFTNGEQPGVKLRGKE